MHSVESTQRLGIDVYNKKFSRNKSLTEVVHVLVKGVIRIKDAFELLTSRWNDTELDLLHPQPSVKQLESMWQPIPILLEPEGVIRMAKGLSEG